jgi:hypothetical protein
MLELESVPETTAAPPMADSRSNLHINPKPTIQITPDKIAYVVEREVADFNVISGLIRALCAASGCVDIRWSVGDVKRVRPDLDTKQCMMVLHICHSTLDPSLDYNKDFIAAFANDIYPKAQAESVLDPIDEAF